MDIVDLPAWYRKCNEYFHDDIIVYLAICAIVAFVIGVWFKSTNESAKNGSSNRKSGQVADENDSYDTDCDYPQDEYEEEKYQHVPLNFSRIPEKVMKEKATAFYLEMKKRRSCRKISSDPVPREIIDDVIRVAGTSPSGANLQPWIYVVVSDPETKLRLRDIVEEEEEINYNRRMGDQWVQDLEKFKTNWVKPYLTEAPYVILLFRQEFGKRKNGLKQTNYYKELSAAISAGFLLIAIQKVGLVTVTTTPLNCGPRIKELLNRPTNEKLILLFPVGYPTQDAVVPDIRKKSLDEIRVHI